MVTSRLNKVQHAYDLQINSQLLQQIHNVFYSIEGGGGGKESTHIKEQA